jgi:hypothetical protein
MHAAIGNDMALALKFLILCSPRFIFEAADDIKRVGG